MKPALLVATRGWDPQEWAKRFVPLLPGRGILATMRDGLFDGPDDALSEVRYLLAWKPQQATLDRLPRLDVIFSLGAGVDHILSLPRIPQAPLVRVVDPDLTGRMAEYVAWQALHHLRRGGAYRRQQGQRLWKEVASPRARDVTVGIMGYGVMGEAAASVLAPLGFRVRAWTRTPRKGAGVELFCGDDQLDAFLAETDILVSLLPLTPQTQGLIDIQLLRKLRRSNALGGAVLVNAGRGGSQVESDIAVAIREGTLIGASLDVFETEPLSPESPLWGLENVVITPHVAAVSDPASLAEGIAAQIRNYEAGEPLRNLVDPARGY